MGFSGMFWRISNAFGVLRFATNERLLDLLSLFCGLSSRIFLPDDLLALVYFSLLLGTDEEPLGDNR